MNQQTPDYNLVNPVPEPKSVNFQRVASVLLTIGGVTAIVIGLFMPWFSIEIGDLGGRAGAFLEFSDGPDETAWSSIGDIALLILIGAVGAAVAAALVLVGVFVENSQQRDRIADFLLGGAGLVVGLGLLLAWFEWEEFSSFLLIVPEASSFGAFDAMYGNGPWVTVGGFVALVAGLTLHLTRRKPAPAPAPPAASSAPSIS